MIKEILLFVAFMIVLAVATHAMFCLVRMISLPIIKLLRLVWSKIS